jgi:hypothetical protein
MRDFRSKPVGWRYESHRHHLASRGISTSKKRGLFSTSQEEAVGPYIKRNVMAKTNGDGVQQFKEDVSWMMRHPWKDLDGEWEEYTKLVGNDAYGPVGKPEPLSDDVMGRSVQRGAALFGRVATQANVEPLVDKDETNKTFRDVGTDFLFGRRIR